MHVQVEVVADFIAGGKVQVRVYTRGRLHAKVYLFDFDPKRIRGQTGAAIVGSSNLSLGGVTHNTELNVRVFGDGNHAELLVFTQYADTAHYLYDNIRHLGRVRAVESGTTDIGRVIIRFAPKANDYELRPDDKELRILVSTDVLSEGLNLLRRSKIAGQALVAQLSRIVRDFNLEEAYGAIADRAEEAPLIPRIVCSEALVG